MSKPEICPTCGRVTSIDKTDEFWKENHWLRAEKLLELLKEIHSNIVYDDLTCPVCGDDGCSVDCRLAKELSDG